MGKILVTGGAGYLGSVLVPKLITEGHSVVVYDALQFGADSLKAHPSLRIVQADIRDLAAYKEAVVNSGAVIHLAGVTNELAGDTDVGLDQASHFESFESLVRASRDAGVRRFIHASSSSLYGVDQATEVTEDQPLMPITEDDKSLAACESILLEQQSSDFTALILRLATICGRSTRMRFDLRVNQFTNHAAQRGVINTSPGPQIRSYISIEDVSDLYIHLLRASSPSIAGRTFNVGSENLADRELAEIVRGVVESEFPEKGPIAIETTDSDEPGSCRLSSRAINETLGWLPERRVEDAVRDICQGFRGDLFTNSLTDPRYYNIRTSEPVLSL